MPLIDGRTVIATAGTRQPLWTARAVGQVTITAHESNTGTVVVGGLGSVVAGLAGRRGTPLAAGDTLVLGSSMNEVSDLAQIGVDGTVTGDVLTWIAGAIL